ncbi:hypothetical protein LEP1GSC163_3488 [Leptospira santarosai str. CBC379]|uniref:Uncharacterized protein n=1 Tax=Leptospira santarosai str. MOR084 TaxID=1049984 RepID=A0A0E2BCU0_9LEPT|nr:hypothetical protein LEP1GSC179_3749 [Leptospira santarosai str. MOR084]EKR91220.1 hypothetical protein LEP1GSC163_3488 [Leptospira santarosai str. CBC379]
MFYPLQDSDFLSFQNTFDLFFHTLSTFFMETIHQNKTCNAGLRKVIVRAFLQNSFFII